MAVLSKLRLADGPAAAPAPAPASTLAAQVRGARKVFDGKAVLDGFDLAIGQGEFIALLGKSGSGKTTLLRMLAGLDDVDSGSVLVAERRTVVFQEPRLVQSKRVIDNVLLGLDLSQRQSALSALEEVGLASHADAWPATLSGGEAQRVALARALLRAPQLLMLDEPFAALDALTRIKMQALVAQLCRRHRPAVLLVTHDVDEAIQLADRVLVLSGGRTILDERIALDHPRQRGAHEFDQLRARLLRTLGVTEAA
ncbi:ATP-binding cassette domain-containing protein [Pseudoduganella sp. FT26W]|uniref:ATP-binding cassette domain-containing protein n=1 Tax=Duganella aquatilis TaxID=2666082 RepID=A0A844D938_9BURK|nr:ABC transporter ATP-binding protein [Duganella aquatilis]MRW87471.1 ATP-binding cassette domain-containing protein [Duganella aquatilis]